MFFSRRRERERAGQLPVLIRGYCHDAARAEREREGERELLRDNLLKFLFGRRIYGRPEELEEVLLKRRRWIAECGLGSCGFTIGA